MWLRRPMEGSVEASEGAEPEGEVSREAFPMVGQHVNAQDNHDVNYNSSSNIIAQQAASAHVCPTHHHQDALAATQVAPAGYVQQACSILHPFGHPGGPGAPGPPAPPETSGAPGGAGAILYTGGGENAAPPPADDSLTLHISNPPFPMGNPDGSGNIWHAAFPEAPPHPQGPHQHHQPLQHHIPGMTAAGDMCVSSPVGEQINPSPSLECGLPADGGFERGCCGIRVQEVQQARGVVGTDVGHGQGGGDGRGTVMENGGVTPGQVVAAAMPGKEAVARVNSRRGRVSVDNGTPESIGMHKLMEHKHWAAVYIKPNSVYKRRAFSSLKQRKRRDLVAVGFNVFHKICDSISSGEPEAFMAAVLNSSHVQKMTKRLRRVDGDPSGSPTQQEEEKQQQTQQEEQQQQQQQQQQEQERQQPQQLHQQQQQHQQQHQQQEQPREQQAAGFNVASAVANGPPNVTAAVAALTNDREFEQSYHPHHHHQQQHQHLHQHHHHHQDNDHSNAGHEMALALNPSQVAAVGTSNYHPPLEHPPVGMADVRAYEQAAFLAADAPPPSAEAAAAAASAAAANAAANAAASATADAANATATAAANAAATAAANAAIATATANDTAAASAAAATAATTLAPAVSCRSSGGIVDGIGDSIRHSIGHGIDARDICFSAAGADNPSVGNAGLGMTTEGDERGARAGLPVDHFDGAAGDVGGRHGVAIATPPPPLQYSPFLRPTHHLAETGTAAGGGGGVAAINANEGRAAERGEEVVMDANVGEMKEARPEPERGAAAEAAAAGGGEGEGEGEGVEEVILPTTTCSNRCAKEMVGVATGAAAAAVATTTGEEGAVGALFPSTACPDRFAAEVVGGVAAEAVATGGGGAVEALFPATACSERCEEESSVDKGCDAGGRDEAVRHDSTGDVDGGGDVAACEMVVDRQGVGVEQGQCVALSEACCPEQDGLVVSGQKRPRLELPEVHEGHEMVGAGTLATEHSSDVNSIDGGLPGVEEGGGIQGIFGGVPCESTHLPDIDIREN